MIKMKNGKEGSPAVKQNDPRHLNESKRPLNFNAIKVGNQSIIWKFNKDNSNLSFDEAGAILLFVHWLQINRYFIRRKK